MTVAKMNWSHSRLVNCATATVTSSTFGLLRLTNEKSSNKETQEPRQQQTAISLNSVCFIGPILGHCMEIQRSQ